VQQVKDEVGKRRQNTSHVMKLSSAEYITLQLAQARAAVSVG
jgi:hypothetical protein